MHNSTTILREKALGEMNVSKELNKVSIAAFVLSGATIGCWAMVTLFAGASNSGGLLSLLNSLVSTITG